MKIVNHAHRKRLPKALIDDKYKIQIRWNVVAEINRSLLILSKLITSRILI